MLAEPFAVTHSTFTAERMLNLKGILLFSDLSWLTISRCSRNLELNRDRREIACFFPPETFLPCFSHHDFSFQMFNVVCQWLIIS